MKAIGRIVSHCAGNRIVLRQGQIQKFHYDVAILDPGEIVGVIERAGAKQHGSGCAGERSHQPDAQEQLSKMFHKSVSMINRSSWFYKHVPSHIPLLLINKVLQEKAPRPANKKCRRIRHITSAAVCICGALPYADFRHYVVFNRLNIQKRNWCTRSRVRRQAPHASLARSLIRQLPRLA
jgi:hypothetical protein